MISEWDMHTECGKVCEVCKETCDNIAGHEGPCHYRKHDEFQEGEGAPMGERLGVTAIRRGWPETWMAIANTIAERSYDPRLKVGAIVVTEDNTQMLAVGYNGNYKGGPHYHESVEPGKSGFIHAEMNALVKCDFNTFKAKHMYVTHSPCRACCKLIINAGIRRVVYGEPYRDPSGLELLRDAGVEVHSVEEAILMAER